VAMMIYIYKLYTKKTMVTIEAMMTECAAAQTFESTDPAEA